MEAELRRTLACLAAADVTGFTYERRSSSDPDARYDVAIFDSQGRLIIEGSDFHSGDRSTGRRLLKILGGGPLSESGPPPAF